MGENYARCRIPEQRSANISITAPQAAQEFLLLFNRQSYQPERCFLISCPGTELRLQPLAQGFAVDLGRDHMTLVDFRIIESQVFGYFRYIICIRLLMLCE